MPAIADEFVGNTTNGFKTSQIVWNNFWDRVCKLSNLVQLQVLKAAGSGKFEEPATGFCGHKIRQNLYQGPFFLGGQGFHKTNANQQQQTNANQQQTSNIMLNI
eukprot:6457485-Amphidinium_carterae.1